MSLQNKCDLCSKINGKEILSGMYLGRLIDTYKVSYIKIDRAKSYHIKCLSKKFPSFSSDFNKKRNTKVFDPSALENISNMDSDVETEQKSQIGSFLLGVSELNLKSMVIDGSNTPRKLSISESPTGNESGIRKDCSGDKIATLSPHLIGNLTPRVTKESLIKFKVADHLLNEFFIAISILYVKTKNEQYLEIMSLLSDILNLEISPDVVKNRNVQHRLIDYQDKEASTKLLKILFSL